MGNVYCNIMKIASIDVFKIIKFTEFHRFHSHKRREPQPTSMRIILILQR